MSIVTNLTLHLQYFCDFNIDRIEKAMGNNQQQEEKFDPNFLQQHQQKMRQIQGNYQANLFDAPGYNYSQPKTKQMHYQSLQRKTAIYKPSIEIEFIGGINAQIQIKFKYQSQPQCQIQINLGVSNVEQDQKRYTKKIQSHYKKTNRLSVGKKLDFKDSIFLGTITKEQFTKLGIVLRMHNAYQTTEYTMAYEGNPRHWKVVIQKYQNKDQACYLEDVFSGGQGGQQCIICMTDTATTMVKPCKHLCLCKDCASSVKANLKSCPICRKSIAQLVTISLN